MTRDEYVAQLELHLAAPADGLSEADKLAAAEQAVRQFRRRLSAAGEDDGLPPWAFNPRVGVVLSVVGEAVGVGLVSWLAPGWPVRAAVWVGGMVGVVVATGLFFVVTTVALNLPRRRRKS